MKCLNCGEEIDNGAMFCPACGTEVASNKKENKVTEAKDEVVTKAKKFKFTRKKIIICVAVIFVIIVFAMMMLTPSTTELQDAYSSACTSEYSTISDDGTALSVDSNPDNEADVDEDDAYTDVQAIDEYLGLPDSLESKMSNTCALDGTREETYDDIEVEWSYSPDNGFEVTYTLK